MATEDDMRLERLGLQHHGQRHKIRPDESHLDEPEGTTADSTNTPAISTLKLIKREFYPN